MKITDIIIPVCRLSFRDTKKVSKVLIANGYKAIIGDGSFQDDCLVFHKSKKNFVLEFYEHHELLDFDLDDFVKRFTPKNMSKKDQIKKSLSIIEEEMSKIKRLINE